jgi:putative transcriptional regulator
MNIKELRKKLKMTQKEFGEYLNIPQRTIQSWELGERTPPPYVIELIKYKIKNKK